MGVGGGAQEGDGREWGPGVDLKGDTRRNCFQGSLHCGCLPRPRGRLRRGLCRGFWVFSTLRALAIPGTRKRHPQLPLRHRVCVCHAPTRLSESETSGLQEGASWVAGARLVPDGRWACCSDTCFLKPVL